MHCSRVSHPHGAQSFRNRLLWQGPLWGHRSCQPTCSTVGSFLHGATGRARSLLQCGLATEPPLSSHLLWQGLPLCCRWMSALPWVCMAQGTAASCWAVQWAARDLCCSLWVTPFPFFPLTQAPAGQFHSRVLPPLSDCCCAQCISHIIK